MNVTKECKNIYLGNTPIKKVFAGNGLVWRKEKRFKVALGTTSKRYLPRPFFLGNRIAVMLEGERGQERRSVQEYMLFDADTGKSLLDFYKEDVRWNEVVRTDGGIANIGIPARNRGTRDMYFALFTKDGRYFEHGVYDNLDSSDINFRGFGSEMSDYAVCLKSVWGPNGEYITDSMVAARYNPDTGRVESNFTKDNFDTEFKERKDYRQHILHIIPQGNWLYEFCRDFTNNKFLVQCQHATRGQISDINYISGVNFGRIWKVRSSYYVNEKDWVYPCFLVVTENRVYKIGNDGTVYMNEPIPNNNQARYTVKSDAFCDYSYISGDTPDANFGNTINTVSGGKIQNQYTFDGEIMDYELTQNYAERSQGHCRHVTCITREGNNYYLNYIDASQDV